MNEPIIFIIYLLFMIVVFIYLFVRGLIILKQVDLEIAKTHLDGKLECRADGVYIGDVKIEGVVDYAVRPVDNSAYQVDLRIMVLSNFSRKEGDKQ